MKKFISLLLIALFTITLVACGGSDDVPEEIIDCLLNPDAEGCEIDPGDDDPVDDRSAAEILADGIIENWNGDVTHLNTLLDSMDFTNSMELTAEFNFEITDNGGVDKIINVVLTDSYLFQGTGDILHRNINMNTNMNRNMNTNRSGNRGMNGIVDMNKNTINVSDGKKEEKTEGPRSA